MNRISHVARIVKGYTTDQLAKILKIEELAYIELEHSTSDLNASQALILSKLYNVEPEILLYTENPKAVKIAMDEITSYIKDQDFKHVQPGDFFRIVNLGNTALSLVADLKNALYENFELTKDNQALKQIVALLEDKQDSSKS